MMFFLNIFIAIMSNSKSLNNAANNGQDNQKSSSKKSKIIDNSHPDQHLVNVEMTDGSKFQIYTSYGKEGDVLKLDVDPKNHPAWQDDSRKFINSNDERVMKFKKKFSGLDFMDE